jgi:hypothetical protein
MSLVSDGADAAAQTWDAAAPVEPGPPSAELLAADTESPAPARAGELHT